MTAAMRQEVGQQEESQTRHGISSLLGRKCENSEASEYKEMREKQEEG